LGVGIGSEDPAATLNVISGAADYAAKFEHSNSDTNASGVYISGGNDTEGAYKAITFANGSDGREISIGYKNASLGIGLVNPVASLNISGINPLKVSAGTNEYAFIVTKDGKVGIASMNPMVDLDVAGTINAEYLTVQSKTLDYYYLPADFTESWIIDKGAGDSGFYSAAGTWTPSNHWGAPYFATANATCAKGSESASITFNITSFTDVQTAYLSFRAKEDSGYIDVYLKEKGGSKIVFHRRINTYQPNTDPSGVSPYPGNNVVILATGLDGYDEVGIKVSKGNFYFSGLALSREKHRAGSGSGFVHWDSLADTPFEDDGSLALDHFLIVGSSQYPKGELHVVSNGEDTIITTMNRVAIGYDSSEVNDLLATLNVKSDHSGYITSFHNSSGDAGKGLYISSGIGSIGRYKAIEFGSSNHSGPKAFIGFNNGNLGVGIAIPSANLEVSGNFIVRMHDEDVLSAALNHSVGIGTDMPSATLNVVTPLDNYVAKFESDTNASDAKGIYVSGGTDAAGKFKALTIADGDGGNLAYVGYDSGNLGIGTTEPAALMHINGAFQVTVPDLNNNETMLVKTDSDSRGKVYIGGDLSNKGFDNALNVSGNLVIARQDVSEARLLLYQDNFNNVANVSNQEGRLHLTAGTNTVQNHLIVTQKSSAPYIGINTSSPTSNLEVEGSIGFNIDQQTSGTFYNVSHSDHTVLISGSTITTVNLPRTIECDKRIYVIKNLRSSAISVDTFGSEEIDGSSGAISLDQYNAITIQAFNGSWYIISKYVP
ncbi:hypothetical protein ACFLZV_07045, partial [Candidatus Margulisiibacteriota bacterium]